MFLSEYLVSVLTTLNKETGLKYEQATAYIFSLLISVLNTINRLFLYFSPYENNILKMNLLSNERNN